ncbi:MAG: hypothetical protein AAGD32_13640 [Planctomycetota bacterium]
MREAATTPQQWPAAMREPTAAAYLDMSPRSLRQAVARGDIPRPVKVPNTRMSVWKKDELDAAIAAWT